MVGMTKTVETICGNLQITFQPDESGRFIFKAILEESPTNTYEACNGSFNESISSLITILINDGVSPDNIIKHLRGNKCKELPFEASSEKFCSCPDAIARFFEILTGKTLAQINGREAKTLSLLSESKR